MNSTYSVKDLVVSTRKGITPKYVVESNVIVLNQKCIRNNRIDYSLAQYHDPEKTFSDEKKVMVGDILINSTGQGTAGRCAFVKELPSNKTVITDSHILIVRTNDFYTAGCLEYSLFSIEKLLQTFMDGSTGQGEFDKQRLFTVHTALPLESNRGSIFNFLSEIDNKVEINSFINKELASMAKTLYDYWFVQFDFPDANGKPYKSSGGKMIYNDELKREIPEGWISDNVLEMASLIGGGTPSKKEAAYWGGDIPFFTPTDSDSSVFSFTTEDYITQIGLDESSTKLFDKNTVFITARGSVGRLALNAIPMAMNQSCYAFKAKEGISYSYLFFLIKELIHHLEVKATGSVFNSIVSNDIEWTKLALPGDLEVIEAYAKITEPMFEKIKQSSEESIELEGLRDWLVPMLMNGQITVK